MVGRWGELASVAQSSPAKHAQIEVIGIGGERFRDLFLLFVGLMRHRVSMGEGQAIGHCRRIHHGFFQAGYGVRELLIFYEQVSQTRLRISIVWEGFVDLDGLRRFASLLVGFGEFQ